MGALRDFVAEVLEIEGSAVGTRSNRTAWKCWRRTRCARRWASPNWSGSGSGADFPIAATAGSASRAIGSTASARCSATEAAGPSGNRAARSAPPADPRSVATARSRHRVSERGVSPAGGPATWTRCLLLAFCRTTAVSDEKRRVADLRLGFNQGTGAVIDDFVPQLRDLLSAETANGRSPKRRRGWRRGTAWEVSTL